MRMKMEAQRERARDWSGAAGTQEGCKSSLGCPIIRTSDQSIILDVLSKGTMETECPTVVSLLDVPMGMAGR